MITAIVLAAGRSRRMGAQKLLLPIGGRPMIARVADAVLAGPVDDAVVVVGKDGQEIAEALAGRAVRFVTNPDPDGEMLGSVRCGLRALPQGCEAALVVLGDQPGLTAGAVAELVRAFRASGSAIVVPAHRGRRGHPVLIAARYHDEVVSRHDGVGLRGLLQAHPDAVLEVAAEPAVLDDVDVPSDYTQAAARFQERQEKSHEKVVCLVGNPPHRRRRTSTEES
ncbi:MAG: nucleotidyltransferase family protein [Planctomycetes bacterium]|nr:nucleotidyltransferase family protein [Planctomycetota bacterium]